MARTFSGTNDRIRTDATFAVPTTVSIAFWGRGPTLSVGHPRALVWGPRTIDLGIEDAGTLEQRLRFERAWTNAPVWTSGNVAEDALWHHYAVTYDGGSTANDAVFYIDGALVSTTENSAPSGTLQTPSEEITIGNRDDDVRRFGGDLAWVSLYNVVLTADEILDAMWRGWTPRGLTGGYLWPLWGNGASEPEMSGSAIATTITGTTGIVDMPPVIPRGLFLRPDYVPYAVSGGGGGGSIVAMLDGYRRRRAA